MNPAAEPRSENLADALEILDLAESSGPRTESCDVCVVGAGAAGAYLVRRLVERGCSVVCLEAGGRRCVDADEVGFNAEFGAEYYPGAVEGRAFGLGGSTSRWGGLLVPHSQHDLRDEDPRAETWRRIVRTVTERSPGVLKCLGYSGDAAFQTFSKQFLASEDAALSAAGLSVVSSLFLPFRKKNLAGLLGPGMPGHGRAKTYLSSVVRSWDVAADGQVTRLQAVSPEGRQLEVAAEHFIVAAGAIESARILLEMRDTVPSGVSMSAAIGECLADHLSIPVADVERQDRAWVNSRFCPRFEGAWMRSFRFMESSPQPGTPRTFAHFVFENENPGFRLAKTVLTSLQARRVPRVSPSELFSGISGVAGLGWGRFIRRQRYIPAETPARMQLDVEQAPDVQNRIRLGSARDRCDRRTVEIDWRITDQDLQFVQKAADRLLTGWESAGADLPKLVRRDLQSGAEKPHDAYHPVGVCRMGTDQDAVVDHELAVRGLRNLSCISTAVLPSAGTANPTFTMLCLTDELAERLAEQVTQRPGVSENRDDG